LRPISPNRKAREENTDSSFSFCEKIKFWLTKVTADATAKIKLGALTTIHASFVSALPKPERDASASKNGCFISVSDTDAASHVEFLEDTDESWAEYRLPIGNGTGKSVGVVDGLMPLKVFMESGSDVAGAKLLLCVKWVCLSRRIALLGQNF
jgi:hypothetical protein